MGDRKEWAKSTNGPDEIDAETMMRALGALHSASVGVVFSPAGIGSTGGVHISAMATFDLLPGSSLPGGVGVDTQWPNGESKTFWGAVYRLLHELDHAIGEVYKQENLWS